MKGLAWVGEMAKEMLLSAVVGLTTVVVLVQAGILMSNAVRWFLA